MKKIILLLVAVAAVSSAQAQFYKNNILGVRGGLNASMLTTDMDDGVAADRQAKMGWFVGLSDQILLSQQLPFYLETGLFLSNKGGGFQHEIKVGESAGLYTTRFGATYLQVPLKINYHIDAGSFSIEPYIGLHYNIGLWGREVHKAELGDGSRRKDVYDIYRGEGFRRSDVGIMLGVGGTWSNLYFGLGWEAGFLNMAKAAGMKAYNSSNFQILVGYNF